MTWQDSPWVEQIYVKKERQLTADFLEVDLCTLCAFLSFLFRPFVNEIIHIVNTRSIKVRAGSSRTMRQKKPRRHSFHFNGCDSTWCNDKICLRILELINKNEHDRRRSGMRHTPNRRQSMWYYRRSRTSSASMRQSFGRTLPGGYLLFIPN